METQERLRRIDPARLAAFQAELLRKEYSVGTVENYLRAVRDFARWSGGMVDRGLVLTWKAQLTAQYAPATVNAMLAGINRFFSDLCNSILPAAAADKKAALIGRPSACRKSLFAPLSKFSELYKSSENLGF